MLLVMKQCAARSGSSVTEVCVCGCGLTRSAQASISSKVAKPCTQAITNNPLRLCLFSVLCLMLYADSGFIYEHEHLHRSVMVACVPL